MVKKFIRKNLGSFTYFYINLRHRVFVVLGLSLLIGVLDGLGLTMFLPLLKMVSGTASSDAGMGNLDFLVDMITSSGFELTLVTILLVMAFFFFLKGIVQYIAAVYKVNVQQKFVTDLRVKTVKGLNELSYKFFVKSDVGRIQNTLTAEVQRVSTAYKDYFTAIQHGIMVLVYMLFAFSINAQFAVMVSIGGVLTNFLYKNLYTKTKGASRKLTTDTNSYQSLIIQNVTNYKYLKATGTLQSYGNKLFSSVKNLEENNKKIGKLSAVLTSAREPIVVTVVVVVIYLQTTFFGSNLGSILISLLFFYRALNYLMQMQVSWNRFLSLSGSLENVVGFEKELNRNKESFGEVACPEEVESLELQDVDFYYGKTAVLQKINLSISKNETIAFVGESGSGKTTLINILAGLFPIEKGQFFINGIDSEQINIPDYQKKIGYITQDAVIFSDSIYNNVTLWAEPSEENMVNYRKAIQKAQVDSFVNSLPDGDETVLGNNGISLSGGQKQRISIARELFKKVEILILDEATSALDSETEKAIQENIDALKGDYTIIIVAHRISTIKNADRILEMRQGRIRHQGTFSNLYKESQYFKKLVELQEL